MSQTFKTHLWGRQESLAGLADKGPVDRVPVRRASEDKASEGRDQGQTLGQPGGSLAVHSQLLVGKVPLGLGCSWEAAYRNLAEEVHRRCYEVGWSHPLQGIHSCPGTLCRGGLNLLLISEENRGRIHSFIHSYCLIFLSP